MRRFISIDIDIDNLDMLGKPFFTTKDNGTGLGLATCYNIATRHKARIDLKTGLNGTTFFVTFNSNGESGARCLSS
jgi:signal transduction histidine kinase